MKKIFTLIVMAVMALGANAQKYYFQEGDVASAGKLDGKVYADGFVKLVDPVGKMAIDANNAYFGDADTQTKFTHRLKSGGKSQTAETKLNQIELAIAEAGTLKIYVRTGSNTATDRNLVVTQGESKLYDAVVQESDAIKVKGLDEADPDKETIIYPVVTVAVAAGKVVLTYPIGSLNFYGFEAANGATAIQTVKAAQANDGAVYNLAGQKVGNDFKGIVIKDGKKMLQK